MQWRIFGYQLLYIERHLHILFEKQENSIE